MKYDDKQEILINLENILDFIEKEHPTNINLIKQINNSIATIKEDMTLFSVINLTKDSLRGLDIEDSIINKYANPYVMESISEKLQDVIKEDNFRDKLMIVSNYIFDNILEKEYEKLNKRNDS